MAYTDESVRELSDIEHILLRVSGYITGKNAKGIAHAIREVVDNSLDEASVTGKGTVRMILFRDNQNHRLIASVYDDGRGIPLGMMKKCYTKLKTSGKFDSNSYTGVAGMYGIGGKVAFAVSEKFRAISSRDGKYGDFNMNYLDYMKKDVIVTDRKETDENTLTHGTVTIMEPRLEIFNGMDEFLEEEFKQFEVLFKLINFFKDYQLGIYIVDKSPAEYDILHKKLFETMSPDEIIVSQQKIFDNPLNIYYVTSNREDKEAFVRSLFDLAMWRHVISLDKPFEDDAGIHLDVYMSIKHHEVSNCAYSVVNNVLFKNIDDTHLTVFRNTLKRQMIPLLKNPDMVKWFLDKYTLPFYYVSYVRASEAEFTGTTKEKFIDGKFEAKFHKWLVDYFKDKKAEVVGIFEQIAADIDAKFKQARENITPAKASKLIFLLNRPTMFNDCREYGPNSELFLCEGNSAKSTASRDSRFQAMYALRGKPLNAIDTPENIDKSFSMLMKNSIFQDIVTILGCKPNDPNLQDMRFGKIFIQTDADEHGRHIANIILGNLYVYNKNIITQGKVYIVLAPLYELFLKGTAPIFSRNKDEYICTLTDNIYNKKFEISTVDIESNTISKPLSSIDIIPIMNSLFDVCDQINYSAKENNIPMEILEQIIRLDLFEMDINKIDPRELAAFFNSEKAIYSNETGILTLSIFNEPDIFINISDMLISDIVEKYKSANFDKTNFFIKHIDKTKDDAVITPVQLYESLSAINEKIRYKHLKGLGSMEKEELYVTCADPETRYTYQINNMADIDNLFKYLGNDSKYRKELMTYQK